MLTNKRNTRRKPKAMLTMANLIELLNLSVAEQAEIEAAQAATGEPLAEICKRGLLAQCRTIASQAEAKAKRADEFQNMSASDLRSSGKHGAALALANRALDAIIEYNNQEAPSNAERWYITQGLVARLANIHQATARKVVEARHCEVADHNAKWGLQPVHNRKQANGEYIEIQDVIALR